MCGRPVAETFGQLFGGLILGFFLGSLLAAQGRESTQPADVVTSAEPTAEEVAKWVAQLRADQYYVRDAATRNLITAGFVAVEAVTKALDNSDLEVTSRGIFVLQRLALAGDLRTEEAARLALEKLAAARVTAAARRAADALDTLQELKQQQALKQLESLGAKIDPQHTEVGLTVVPALAVEVGAEWRGQEQDLRRLKWLQNVEQITLGGKRVTDRWVAHIRDMQNLTIVKINKAAISSAALENLKALPRLRYVKLLYVPIGDDAVDRLKECPQIEKVLAYGTGLTLDGELRLKALGMDVDRRRGAFLGISVPRRNEGSDWSIDHVTANSAADKAGLKTGDVIVKYGERDVNDFDTLMAMIAANDAGDKVTIEIRREAEILVKEITFGFWE